MTASPTGPSSGEHGFTPDVEAAIDAEVAEETQQLELEYAHKKMRFYAIISIAWGTLAILLAFALISLSGDSTLGTDPSEAAATPRLTSMWVDTVDGRTVPCVWGKDGGGGGLSCDWGYTGPTPENTPTIDSSGGS